MGDSMEAIVYKYVHVATTHCFDLYIVKDHDQLPPLVIQNKKIAKKSIHYNNNNKKLDSLRYSTICVISCSSMISSSRHWSTVFALHHSAISVRLLRLVQMAVNGTGFSLTATVESWEGIQITIIV